MQSFRDTPEWAKGHQGEFIVAGLLRKGGWYVVPSYDYAGEDGNKAPRMQGRFNSFVIPDLDACKEGSRVWVEVKTKENATLHRKTQVLEHGIPLRHYHDYLRVQSISGCSVYIVVYEVETGQLLKARLDSLEKHKRIYQGDKMSRGGMVFWPRSQFTPWTYYRRAIA